MNKEKMLEFAADLKKPFSSPCSSAIETNV